MYQFLSCHYVLFILLCYCACNYLGQRHHQYKESCLIQHLSILFIKKSSSQLSSLNWGKPAMIGSDDDAHLFKTTY